MPSARSRICARASSGRPGTSPVEQRVDRLAGERLEEERAEAARARAPAGVAIGQLRPGERDHEDRLVPRPLEQVLDELDERGVGPLDVLEDQDDGALLGHALEEQPPAGEEILAVRGAAVAEAEQLLQARLDERALLRVGDHLLDHPGQLCERGLGRLVLADPRPHPHHLGERPEGDRVAVGEAAALVPPDGLDEAVDVLLELPGEARLADAGDPDDREEVRLLLVGRAVEELLDEAQLAVAADERRLEPGGASLAAAVGDHAQRAPELGGLALALELVRARVLVGDRRLAGAPRRVADEHRARLGRRLDARRGVDEVARDHALALGAERDRRLAGEDAGADAQRPRRDPRTAETSSSAARTARSASSSCATGAPQTAITASPMNFSTRPP